jgi:crossover junction endodeoxyribonuclease RusA
MPTRIVIPFPPSVNHYWATSGKRKYLTKRAKVFREQVTAAAIEQGVFRKWLDGPLCLTIAAHPPDRHRRDLDNLLKATQDALQMAGVYHDDWQICDLRMRWAAMVPGGQLDVTISDWEPMK